MGYELRVWCQSCGKERTSSSRDQPREALKSWVTVSYRLGPGISSHQYFCSLTCLKKWLDENVPTVPDIFLSAFKDEDSESER